MIDENILEHFGVNERIFLEALKSSPSAQGYIAGAISELLLKEYLETKNYEVVRIKEKPSGGNNAKNYEARGDFYIRREGNKENKWLVIESKGLKSNSEFRGAKLNNPDKVYNFLKNRVFDLKKTKETILNKGYKTYLKTKGSWQRKNPRKAFPEFKWNPNFPGAECYNLDGIWRNKSDLKKWVFSLDKSCFSEESYRNIEGAITVLETHQPSKRVGIKTGIDQAAPLVYDFNIMCVDLFLRTKKHEFVFMNSGEISHSPTSPEHLYQNYIIDILVKDKKMRPTIQVPWYDDVDNCINKTKPLYRPIDPTQVDNR